MKRLFLLFCGFVAMVTIAKAEMPGFEWTVGADVTSTYLWRGQNLGGLSFQPDVMLGYGGFQLEAWGNIGTLDYTFKTFNPELDLTLSYNIFGFKVGVTHYHYFDGSKFFYLRPYSYKDYVAEKYNTDQLEVFLEFNLGDILENVPLKFGWYTYVAGDDMYPDYDNPIISNPSPGVADTTYNMKQAYSTYIELGYDVKLPKGFTLTPTVGITPWKGYYTDYEGKFGVNNISLKLNWEYEVNDHLAIDIYAMGMVNTYGINKQNLITAIADTYNNQRLNGCIGLGIWLY